tara:strand:- start:1200 stop:1706 length:507 start_codon:yes stop_codon:yes gene_type:complete
MAKKKLTPKMLAFCDCIALEGKNLSQSYRDAYSAENMSAAAIHTEASLLASNPAITKRIETLRERKVRSLVCSSVSDADLVLQKLREWVDTATPVDSNRIRAAELLGKSANLFAGSEVVIVDRSPEEIAEELRQRLESALSAELSADDEPTSSDDLNDLSDDDSRAVH